MNIMNSFMNVARWHRFHPISIQNPLKDMSPVQDIFDKIATEVPLWLVHLDLPCASRRGCCA